MREKITEIVEIIEKADAIFKGFDIGKEEARVLWDAGIERLVAAIWVCEMGEDKTEQAS